jgi:hypothetical protein
MMIVHSNNGKLAWNKHSKRPSYQHKKNQSMKQSNDENSNSKGAVINRSYMLLRDFNNKIKQSTYGSPHEAPFKHTKVVASDFYGWKGLRLVVKVPT